jgi:hypothetical protein
MPWLGGEAVMEQQVALNNGASFRGGGGARDDFIGELGEAIDATPRFVAGLVLGAVLTLFLLRMAGFRFSFGVGVGGGGA